MRIVYGPVLSWRLGRSLGIDPIAARTKRCPFSCVYCQYGETPEPSAGRRVYVSADDLVDELRGLPETEADGVTFAGMGEPTLAANLSDLLAAVRECTSLPVSILTGGALLPDPHVRQDLTAFDQIVVTVNAADEALFRRVNRPGPRYPYSLRAIVDGLCRLRRSAHGRLVVQVMLIGANVHAAPAIAALLAPIAPDTVCLNTPLRPALGGPLSHEEMRRASRHFSPFTVQTVYDAPHTLALG